MVLSFLREIQVTDVKKHDQNISALDPVNRPIDHFASACACVCAFPIGPKSLPSEPNVSLTERRHEVVIETGGSRCQSPNRPPS